MIPPLLEVKNLFKKYRVKKKVCHALTDVSFSLQKGETLGIVGESGCGKSTLAKSILHLTQPSSGDILFEGRSTLKFDKKELFNMRKRVQMVFQDPYGSLNPRMTVHEIISEPLEIFNIHGQNIEELLVLVGLKPDHGKYLPHELSGGQRQRVGIARALALKPDLLVCDEPVAALDVSIQAQVIALLNELQEQFTLTYLFISHDLAMVKYISDRIAVMYLGQIVEIAETDELFNHPLHPYTKSLLSAIPVADPFAKDTRHILYGEVPTPFEMQKGCPFASRCPHQDTPCQTHQPLLEITPNHFVACHLAVAQGKKNLIGSHAQ